MIKLGQFPISDELVRARKAVILWTMDTADSTSCSGCGAYGGIHRYNQPHNCFVNEDGSREEGGIFL